MSMFKKIKLATNSAQYSIEDHTEINLVKKIEDDINSFLKKEGNLQFIVDSDNLGDTDLSFMAFQLKKDSGVYKQGDYLIKTNDWARVFNKSKVTKFINSTMGGVEDLISKFSDIESPEDDDSIFFDIFSEGRVDAKLLRQITKKDIDLYNSVI